MYIYTHYTQESSECEYAIHKLTSSRTLIKTFCSLTHAQAYTLKRRLANIHTHSQTRIVHVFARAHTHTYTHIHTDALTDNKHHDAYTYISAYIRVHVYT